MAYVVPKEDCPHVQDIELEPDKINISAPCVDCGDTSENWLCCQCYGIFCSRYVQGHMRQHNSNSHHPIALSFSDLSIWCYECDSYVSQTTGNIVYHTHIIKHKCPPGMASISREEMEQVQSLVLGIGADVGFDTILATVSEIEEEKEKGEKGEKARDREQNEHGKKRTLEDSNTTSTSTTTSSTSTSTTSNSNSNSNSNSTTSTNNSTVNTTAEFVPVEGLDPSSYDNPVINRILGCIYGNALGDAVGLATEFMSKREIQQVYKGGSLNFPNFVRNHHNRRWKLGDWTDDTDQLILILETLLEKKEADPVLYANKLKHWIYNGFRELGDLCGMGLGATTARVVDDPNFLKDPIATAFKVWDESGRYVAPNGGVMRTSIVGCYKFADEDTIIKNSDSFCKVTHADPRCIASCRAVVVAVSELLKEAQRVSHQHTPKSDSELTEAILAKVRGATRGLLEGNDSHIKDFEFYLTAPSLSAMTLDEGSTIGYTFKAMGSGFYGLRSTASFEDTIEALAKEGGDADTYKALPHKWLAALPNKKWLDKKVVQFLHLAGHL